MNMSLEGWSEGTGGHLRVACPVADVQNRRQSSGTRSALEKTMKHVKDPTAVEIEEMEKEIEDKHPIMSLAMPARPVGSSSASATTVETPRKKPPLLPDDSSTKERDDKNEGASLSSLLQAMGVAPLEPKPQPEPPSKGKGKGRPWDKGIKIVGARDKYALTVSDLETTARQTIQEAADALQLAPKSEAWCSPFVQLIECRKQALEVRG